MKNSHGFSLVEVLVVIAFIGIMTGVLFVSLSGKRTETSLKSAAREVAAAVRTAQNSALTGVKTGVPDGRSLCRYDIERTSASTYEIFVRYSQNNGSCPGNNNDRSSLGRFSLKNGVSFSGGNWSVLFDVPRGNVSATASIGLTKSGSSFSVCVPSSGSITEKVSCP